jgi:DNA invertase Pin-like site-specific DNA recombinase
MEPEQFSGTNPCLSRKSHFRAIAVVMRAPTSLQENIETSASLGQAIFTIVSAVAQLERDLICERVAAGIRNARANGKRLGRPRQHVDPDRILELQASGLSLRQVAAHLNVGYGAVRAELESSERKKPNKSGEEIIPSTGVPAGL